MNWREQIEGLPNLHVQQVDRLKWLDLLDKAVAPPKSRELTQKLADLKLGAERAKTRAGEVPFVGIYVQDIRAVLDMIPGETESVAVAVGPELGVDENGDGIPDENGQVKIVIKPDGDPTAVVAVAE